MSSVESTKHLAAILRPVFHLWPAYNFGDGLVSMSSAFWQREILFQDKRPLDWNVAGKPIVLLHVLVIPYFLLLLFVEFSHDGGAGGTLGRMLRWLNEGMEKTALRWFHGVESTHDGALRLDDGLRDDENDRDLDVLEEEAFVRENSSELKATSPVLFENLWKIYLPSVGMFGSLLGTCKRFILWMICCCGFCQRDTAEKEKSPAHLPKRAVRGMSTAIRKGEIYALLGANGAGELWISFSCCLSGFLRKLILLDSSCVRQEHDPGNAHWRCVSNPGTHLCGRI